MRKILVLGYLLIVFTLAYMPVNAAVVHDGTALTPAYDFKLTTLDGKVIRLSDFRGKVVILDFWATWCPPCRAEIPDFIKLYNKYKKQGLVIIGAAVDDRARVEQFVEDYGVTYRVAIADQETIDGFGGIRGIPTTFVIDKKGNIAASYTGFRPEDIFVADFKNNM